MKKCFVISGSFLLILASLYIIGCGTKIEKFGDAPGDTEVRTPIASIVVNPQEYIDKDVVIEGTIASECPAGGWINVKDNSDATIYVEMHGAEFAPIPQRVGKSVTVKGKIYQTEGTPKETQLLGKGLVIK